MNGFWIMTPRQSRSPIGGEESYQTTQGFIVVEYASVYSTDIASVVS